MQWKRDKIILPDGTEQDTQAPTVISASRATDISILII